MGISEGEREFYLVFIPPSFVRLLNYVLFFFPFFAFHLGHVAVHYAFHHLCIYYLKSHFHIALFG